MARIVFPTTGLLNTQRAPLDITQGTVLGDLLGSLLWQDDVPVLELSVLVLLGVVDLCD